LSDAPQVTQNRYSGGFGERQSVQRIGGRARSSAGGLAEGDRAGAAAAVWGPNEKAGAAGRERLPAEGGPEGELPRSDIGAGSICGAGGLAAAAATAPAAGAEAASLPAGLGPRSTFGMPFGGVGATPRCWRRRLPQS
jgi:hypothetical protein